MVDAATDLQMRNDSSYGVLFSAARLGLAARSWSTCWSTKEFEVSASTGARYAPTPRATVAEHRPGLRRRAPARTASPSTWCAP